VAMKAMCYFRPTSLFNLPYCDLQVIVCCLLALNYDLMWNRIVKSFSVFKSALTDYMDDANNLYLFEWYLV
jgi:hypothetical protein